MNISAILEPLLIAYGWLIPVLIGISFLKSPFIKGIVGELKVNLAAKFFLDKKHYILFKNVILPTADGTTQIDHIIVSRYGVFVLETKNMKGWIFGESTQKTWTQKVYRYTYKFQNPLHQNYKHTQTLQSFLKIKPQAIFSLIVFIGDSHFKTAMPENVVYARGYIRYIKNKKQRMFSDIEVQQICSQIQSARLKPSLKTNRAHVKHVKTIVEKKQRELEAKAGVQKIPNSCPKCGQIMVLRTAQRGRNKGQKFWGCSAYPACRAVMQVL